VCALQIALVTSSWVAEATWAISSPVAGSMTGKRSPLVPGTQDPPM
jgi:hypothetical protein